MAKVKTILLCLITLSTLPGCTLVIASDNIEIIQSVQMEKAKGS